jgi:hypothetical protein
MVRLWTLLVQKIRGINRSAAYQAFQWTALVFAIGLFVLLIQWAAVWLDVVSIEPWRSFLRNAGLGAMLIGIVGAVLVDAYFDAIDYPRWGKLCLVGFPIFLGCMVALITIKAGMIEAAHGSNLPSMDKMQYGLLFGTIFYATILKYLQFEADET